MPTDRDDPADVIWGMLCGKPDPVTLAYTARFADGQLARIEHLRGAGAETQAIGEQFHEAIRRTGQMLLEQPDLALLLIAFFEDRLTALRELVAKVGAKEH